MSGIGVDTSSDISNADGVTTIFTYTFFAYDASQVKIYSILNNVPTPITTGFTITPNSNYVGGSVTFDVAPAASVGKIFRTREVPYTQTTEFTDIIRYKETAIERALNTLEMQIQQDHAKVLKSLRYADDVTVTNPVIGTPVDGQLLAFSGTDGKILGVTLGSISNLSTVFTSLTSGDFLNYNGTNWVNRKHLAAKGTPIASAATVDLGAADSDFIDLTGTATIASLGATTTRNHVWVNCTGAMTFTHNGTSLIMPGAANRTAAVGDKYEFVRISGSNWACVGYALANGEALKLTIPNSSVTAAMFNSGAATSGQVFRADGSGGGSYGTVIQIVGNQTGAVATGSTAMPWDDTIPQNTEGDQYLTQSITPKSATSKLKIDIMLNVGIATNNQVVLGLFQDSNVGAIASSSLYVPTSTGSSIISLTHFMTSGTTSSTTFNVRAGISGGGTLTLNGLSGARKLGGVCVSSIIITEIL